MKIATASFFHARKREKSAVLATMWKTTGTTTGARFILPALKGQLLSFVDN